ncbi:PucR family transcriptional regulator [Nocardia crassostreae]|uniref:PucR family transcriptional regulator n=1 Tax=Nocardia crassostreae TaxID=53428 RepID=UPI001FDF4B00|nr:helix-turn-helix domain-containing protein [Nocardia crassostreae]
MDRQLAARPLTVSGRPLADRLAQGTHMIVTATVEHVSAQVAFYRTLPPEAIRRDVTAIVGRNLELLVTTLREDRDLRAAELAPIERSARRRAEERVPLTDVITTYHLGTQLWWQTIVEWAEPGDSDALVRVGVLLQRHLQAVTHAVLAGYGADQAPLPPQDHHRRQLYRALTTGAAVEDTARSLGLVVAPRYWVVALRVAAHPDEQVQGVDATVASRRKTRRLEYELDWLGRGETLHTVTAQGGCALIPAPETAAAESRFDELARQLGDLERAAGAATLCAVELAVPHDIPAVHAEVAELLRVAVRYHRDAGVVRFRDLALEYQLTRPTRVSHLNAAELALRRTLETYLAHDLNTTATAAALHVHANTVLYRLRKITDLTGLDPAKTRDLLRIAAALAATPDR